MLEGDNLSMTKTLSPLLPIGQLQPVMLRVRICHGPVLQISVRASGKQFRPEVLQRRCKREQKPASHQSPAAHILVGETPGSIRKAGGGKGLGGDSLENSRARVPGFHSVSFFKKKKKK